MTMYKTHTFLNNNNNNSRGHNYNDIIVIVSAEDIRIKKEKDIRIKEYLRMPLALWFPFMILTGSDVLAWRPPVVQADSE